MSGVTGVEMAENTVDGLQTDAAQGFPQTAKAKGCKALTAKGLPCTMPAIFGTDLCMAHTPGFSSIAGRKGGRPRRLRVVDHARPPAQGDRNDRARAPPGRT